MLPVPMTADLQSVASSVAHEILERAYGLRDVQLAPLGGEQLNLLVELPSEQQYVLKVHSPDHDHVARLEMAATAHVGARLQGTDISVPSPVAALDGRSIVHAVTSAG